MSFEISLKYVARSCFNSIYSHTQWLRLQAQVYLKMLFKFPSLPVSLTRQLSVSIEFTNTYLQKKKSWML